MIGWKKNLITIKGQKITQSDFRGILALVLVAAFIYVATLGNCEAISSLGPLAGSAVTYYFQSKERLNSNDVGK